MEVGRWERPEIERQRKRTITTTKGGTHSRNTVRGGKGVLVKGKLKI